MHELVLDLITSYENRISAVEELITTTHQATVSSDGRLGVLDEERETLKNSLQTILARNCSLRRKDFNRLMERVIFDAEGKRVEIEEERKRVVEKVKGYLDEQKGLAICLRQQLVELMNEKTDKTSLNMVINNIKITYLDTGQQLFAMLHEFQSRLATFQREQEEVNDRLKRLVDRGESLRLEDLRQLETTKDGQERRAERELRRQEVERLLAHFKERR